MDINILSVSFVGVFSTPLTMIPQLDTEFCQNVFHNPEMTISGYTPAGFLVKHKTFPVPSILINPAKIVIIANNLNDLLNLVSAVATQLENPYFASYGLNSEIEWRCKENAEDWLNLNFIQQNKRLGKITNKCRKVNLIFDVTDKESLNIDFEPRMGVENGVFASVNHHHDYPMTGFPNQELLNNEFSNSLKVVAQHITNLVLSNE